MGVCIGYTLICWVAEVGRIGNMHPGIRYHLLFPAGLPATIIGLLLSLVAHRRRPVLARWTLAACLLWGVWSVLPRV